MKKEIAHYLRGDEMPKLRVSTSLRFCTQCSTVWETWHLGQHFFMKYKDMPTYGLKRKDCQDCDER